VNNVNLIGRLVRDPETRYAQGDQGTAITSFTLAVDRRVKREGQPTADYIRIVAFGKTAEFAGKYYHKGLRVGVTGHIQTGSYKDREGRTVYTTDVIADSLDFADGKQDNPAPSQTYAQPPAPAPAPQQQAIAPEDFMPYEGEEDLPF
jgi:single-strand DNA-binding protein